MVEYGEDAEVKKKTLDAFLFMGLPYGERPYQDGPRPSGFLNRRVEMNGRLLRTQRPLTLYTEIQSTPYVLDSFLFFSSPALPLMTLTTARPQHY